MKARELIAEPQKCDPDLNVCYFDNESKAWSVARRHASEYPVNPEDGEIAVGVPDRRETGWLIELQS